MVQENRGGAGGQAAWAEGLGEADGEGAGAGACVDPGELAVGEDSRPHPASTAQAATAPVAPAQREIGERITTAGSLRKAARPAWRLGRWLPR
jgi:hypothetical protein